MDLFTPSSTFLAAPGMFFLKSQCTPANSRRCYFLRNTGCPSDRSLRDPGGFGGRGGGKTFLSHSMKEDDRSLPSNIFADIAT